MNKRARPGPAFSLVEIVVAIGILAVTLVVLLGLAGATVRSASAAADLAVAARLDANIRSEMERLKADLGLAELAALVPSTAQLHDARHDALRLLIDRHEAFGMELTQGHLQGYSLT